LESDEVSGYVIAPSPTPTPTPTPTPSPSLIIPSPTLITTPTVSVTPTLVQKPTPTVKPSYVWLGLAVLGLAGVIGAVVYVGRKHRKIF